MELIHDMFSDISLLKLPKLLPGTNELTTTYSNISANQLCDYEGKGHIISNKDIVNDIHMKQITIKATRNMFHIILKHSLHDI